DATLPERIGADARQSLAAKRLPDTASPLMAGLIAGTATTHDLRAFEPTKDIAERLDAIARAAGADCSLHLDDVDRVRGYYTGLRFRAYDPASRATIAQGGRYDDLYGRFGAEAPAVGF